MKGTIKVQCCDMWKGFDFTKHSQIYRLLSTKYSLEMSNNPNFLFYSCFGRNYEMFNNCVKIFFTHENILPNFNECDYALGFDYIKFENRYFRFGYDYITNTNIQLRNHINETHTNRKFCNFIYSHGGDGTRGLFCKLLSNYKSVDCPGNYLHNIDTNLVPRFGNNETRSKIDFLPNYKFTIAFENSSTPGYHTEKISQPFRACSVPIYWGDPCITREFNPQAFVNCHDFASFEEVVEYVKFLDNNDDAYLTMLRQPPMQPSYDFDREKHLLEFLVNIIERGNTPVQKGRIEIFDQHNREIRELRKKLTEFHIQSGQFAEAEELIQKVMLSQSQQTWGEAKLKEIHAKQQV